MGVLEKELKQRTRRQNIQKVILGVVFTAGVLGVGLVAPNVLGVLGKMAGPNKRKKNIKYSINESFTRLKEKGLIDILEINGKKVVRVTRKGEAALDFLVKHNFKIKIPKRWDGRWRIVIFDIKESRKKSRFQLRHTLSQIGFVKLQNSVWVYPYDCEDLVSLIKSDFKLGKDVLYMIVEKLENDWSLRKIFGLPNSDGRKS